MDINKKSQVLIILGPTATGKTDLALNLARKFNGELVACDSRQVYVSLDIGTGKLPGNFQEVKKGKGFWEIDGIKIWMYDVVDPKQQYSVADYVRDANKVIEDILSRGKLPIVVGGTGFYLKALLEGIDNLAILIDEDLRRNLQKLSLAELQNKFKSLSPTKYENLNRSDRQNSRRLIRGIELTTSRKEFDKTTKSKSLNSSDNWIPAFAGMTEFNILKIGLRAPREIIYQKVDARVLDRLNQGMIEEAEDLFKQGLTLERMKELGLEYGVLADFLAGIIQTKEELTKILQNKIHGYVRRQETWFKKDQEIKWFDVTTNYINNVEMLVSAWYDRSNG